MSANPNVIDLSDHTAPAALPWSAEAEQGVIGCLLLDNRCFDAVASVLRSTDFYNASHRLVFEAIEALLIACKPADVLTVHEQLRRRGLDEQAGGAGYLLQMSQSVASPRHAGEYAAIVADHALRRALLTAAGDAQDLIRSVPEANQALDRVAALFANIERIRGGGEPQRLSDVIAARLDHWDGLQRGETSPGIPTHIPTLDRALAGGLRPGKVIVLAARPSVGKTSLAQQVAISVAKQGHGVLLISQEMSAGELVDRAVANLGQMNLGGISEGRLQDQDWSKLVDVAESSRDLPLFIDDQPAQSLLSIKSKARNVQKRAPLALLVVDYLQLCASATQRGSRHHEIEAISRGLKALSKELAVCVLLLSQINRASTQRDEPTLADLKESGAIEEDADVVIFLQPKGNLPDGSQLLAAILAKNRQGRRGRVALAFHGPTQRWVESTADVSQRTDRSPS